MFLGIFHFLLFVTLLFFPVQTSNSWPCAAFFLFLLFFVFERVFGEAGIGGGVFFFFTNRSIFHGLFAFVFCFMSGEEPLSSAKGISIF